MTTINTINTIEDLARILQEQPTWAEALRALLLTRELLELPERFDRSVQAQQETNRQFRQRFDNIEGRLGNLEGAQYERTVRTKALARTQIALGFEGARVALNQEGLVDPQLNSSVARAVPGRTCHSGRLHGPLRDRHHNLSSGQPARCGRGLHHRGRERHRPGQVPGWHPHRCDGRDSHAHGHHSETGPGAIRTGGSGGRGSLCHRLPVEIGRGLSIK